MSETPAQYTQRMREKYKESLEELETIGLSQTQKDFDELICLLLDLKPLKDTAIQKLLKDLNQQISNFIKEKK